MPPRCRRDIAAPLDDALILPLRFSLLIISPLCLPLPLLLIDATYAISMMLMLPLRLPLTPCCHIDFRRRRFHADADFRRRCRHAMPFRADYDAALLRHFERRALPLFPYFAPLFRHCQMPRDYCSR